MTSKREPMGEVTIGRRAFPYAEMTIRQMCRVNDIARKHAAMNDESPTEERIAPVVEMLAVALGEFTPGLTADELWESAGSITDLTEALQTIQTASGYAKKEAGAGEAPAP